MNKSLEKVISDQYKESFEDNVLKLINLLKHDQSAISIVENMAPFNHPDLKDIKWQNVESATIENGLLTLKMKEE